MAALKGPYLCLVASLLCLCQAEARAKDLYAYGEYLSGECVTCHRLNEDSHEIPAIFGWPEDRFIETLALYKHGARENAAMRNVAASLGDEEMAALARFFSRQTPEESTQ